jgi:hypothetical protein
VADGQTLHTNTAAEDKCVFCGGIAVWTSPTGHTVCQSCRTAAKPLALGTDIIDHVDTFLARFVAYPSDHARLAHALWIIHCHLMDVWESTPRIAFLSPEPGSGKTRALEITEMLVPNPVEAVNVTPAYLFRKVGDDGAKPTILFDEIDTVFGPKARENEEIRGLLNAGHRRGAVAGRCVVKGRAIITEEIPAYCAVALAGIGDLPDTLLSRAIVVRMRRRAPGELVEPFRRRVHGPAGEGLHEALVGWAERESTLIEGAFPDMPNGIEDRDADIWEPLLAIADRVGGVWPDRSRVAAVALVADSKAGSPSLGIKLLADLHQVFGVHEAMSTEAILKALLELEESPWGDLYGKQLNSRGLAQRLRKYEVKSKNVRIGEMVVKGYSQEDLYDVWVRYLPYSDVAPMEDAKPYPHETLNNVKYQEVGALPLESATSATSATACCDHPIPGAHRFNCINAKQPTTEEIAP